MMECSTKMYLFYRNWVGGLSKTMLFYYIFYTIIILTVSIFYRGKKCLL